MAILIIIFHFNSFYFANLRLIFILLAIAAEAKMVDEIINSPEINPNIPVINMMPVIISLCKSVIF